jgi:hypothetical protein
MIHPAKHSVLALALIACLAGCGRRDGLTSISGTIAYDGQPVKKGTVTFVPADGNGPTAAAPIVDGKYSVKILPGRKLVRIEAFKVTGTRRYSRGNPNSPMVDMQEQILPARFNTKSKLTREIAPTESVYDFALEESPPRSGK